MKKLLLFSTLFALTITVKADITVPMYTTDHAQFIGNVTFKQSTYGVLIAPNLKNLTPGLHGFHIHDKPYCDDKGMAAGGHWDPAITNKHLGPYDKGGHLGDLPVLYVDTKGVANTPILAPRLTLDEISQHALIIHQDGDNYSDTPKTLGGGGARIACGIIK